MKRNKIAAIAGAALLGSLLFAHTSYALNPNWYQDEKGLHYYTDSSNMAKSKWVSIDGNWYYFDSNTVMKTGWLKDKNKWYYLKEDGAMATGWLELDGKSYYLTGSGDCVMNDVTPDYFMTNAKGEKIEGIRVIAGVKIQTNPAFVTSGSAQMSGWKGIKQDIDSVGAAVFNATGSTRMFHVYDDHIAYSSLPSKEQNSGSSLYGNNQVTFNFSGSTSNTGSSNQTTDEKPLIELYKDNATGGYRIDILTTLNRTISDSKQAGFYDPQILRFFCYEISSYPAALDDAIYSAWAERNTAGINRFSWVTIGDCQVLYEASNGRGRFLIRPIEGMTILN